MREKEIRDLLELARNDIFNSEEVRTVAAITALLEAVEMLVEDLSAPKPPVGSVVIYSGGWKEIPACGDGWGPRSTRIDIIKTIRNVAVVSLTLAKEMAEKAWAGTPVRIACESPDVASALVAALIELGGKAELAE